MTTPPARAGAGAAPPTPAGAAALVPCLMLKKGDIHLPSGDGPVPARTAGGARYDPFEVVDRLAIDYPLIYLVDLDGVELGEPQLDFLQELSRDISLWVDGGVRTADQAIDILVGGAERAVLSSATLRGPDELRRAWRLSTEFAFEIEVDGQGLVAAESWETRDPLSLARQVRAVGVDHLVYSPREVDPDWALARTLAGAGPTWVDGSFAAADAPRLAVAGARGGIFHLDRFLESLGEPPPAPSDEPLPRDDEA